MLFRDVHRFRVRRRGCGDRAVLLPGRSQGLSGSGLLRRARAAFRRARRFRAGLRRRSRVRPSRAEPARAPMRAAARDRRTGAHSASVALELQADCYAGVWGNHASQGGRFQAGKVELEPGDAEQALRAAASIGDDRLQKMSPAGSSPTASRTAAPLSASNGSAAAWNRATQPSAIPSARLLNRSPRRSTPRSLRTQSSSRICFQRSLRPSR